MLSLVMCASAGKVPQPPKKVQLRKRRLEEAIRHAHMICRNFEDTTECKVAWGLVEELSAAEHVIRTREKERARLKNLYDDDDDLAIREYDL
jgi:hypothetical protein